MAVAVVLLPLLAALFAVPCARLSERLAIIPPPPTVELD